MSRFPKHLPPKFLKNIEEVTYIVRGSQVMHGLDELPFHVTVRAEKHRRLSFNIKEGNLHISEKDEEDSLLVDSVDIEDSDADEANINKEKTHGAFVDEVYEDDDEEQENNNKDDNKEQENNDEEDDEEQGNGKRSCDSTTDDKTVKKTKHDVNEETVLNNANSTYKYNGQTVVTRCPLPWRKQPVKRPSSPASTEHQRRRLISKALAFYHSDYNDYDALAIRISGHLTGRYSFPDEHPSTPTTAPDDSSDHPTPRPSSPDGLPCSPAYSPTEAIVDDASEASAAEKMVTE